MLFSGIKRNEVSLKSLPFYPRKRLVHFYNESVITFKRHTEDHTNITCLVGNNLQFLLLPEVPSEAVARA